MIKFNNQVKLILSDVDETVADLYIDAEPGMISELTSLLNEGRGLFLISGASLSRIRQRIVNHLPANLRSQVLISHCSGAEVWGFESNGEQHSKPYYSVYDDVFSETQKRDWRIAVQRLIGEFKLQIFPATSVPEFKNIAGENPLVVMFEDRGPQITMEVVNGYNISAELARSLGFKVPEHVEFYDIRDSLQVRALELFHEYDIPVTPRYGGEFALDFATAGINKTTSIRYVLDNKNILEHIGLNEQILADPSNFEIWGDKFSVSRGGPDRHMSEAMAKEVRSIDFREENPSDFMPGYNTVLWEGMKHLHHGLLEYLQSRNK